MSDPNRGQYHKLYSVEFAIAKDFLDSRYGGSLSWCDADYEAFQFKTEGVRLVFYPHKTSAGNYHIRVRDGGSKNKNRARAIILVIQFDLAKTCTFSAKKESSLHYNEKRKNEIRNFAKCIEV